MALLKKKPSVNKEVEDSKVPPKQVPERKKVNPKAVAEERKARIYELEDELKKEGAIFPCPVEMGGNLNIDNEYLVLSKYNLFAPSVWHSCQPISVLV